MEKKYHNGCKLAFSRGNFPKFQNFQLFDETKTKHILVSKESTCLIYRKNYFLLPNLVTFLLLVILSFTISYAEGVEKGSRLPIAMEAFLKKPKARQYEIHIHLTNVSPSPIGVNVQELPWIPPNDSKWLSAFRMDDQHSQIKQHSFLGKFGSRSIRLLPGESVEDKLVLNHRITTLLEDIEVYGVELKSDCPPPSLKFVCKEGTEQTLLIPKGDPGKPDVYIIDQGICDQLEKDIGLVSVPEDHAVLFLLTAEDTITDLDQVQSLLYSVDEYVRQCRPMWTNSWAVSFFTKKHFAGFLTDDAGRRSFEEGLWQQANIAQYSSQIRTLFRFPWIKKKADSVYLSVWH